MINKDLLAATAVFAELVNNSIDYKEVINNFILSIYSLEKKYSMDSQAVCGGLIKHYDFDIPEAVIRTQLISLYKKDHIDYRGGNYIVSPDILEKNSEISKELGIKTQLQNSIFDKLIKYITDLSAPGTIIKREEIDTYFVNYLFDESFNGEYSGPVSTFILQNSNDDNFKNELNLIREGIIILKGLKYSSDSDDDLQFRNELHIYLDTEHVFSLNGYNGELHKKIAMDFYDLVRDLNSKQPVKKIFLHYFEDAKIEIERLFISAINIFQKKKTKDISSTAMKFILNGITDKSDIIRKESKFFENLKNMGIFEADLIEIPAEEFASYNLESNTVLQRYSAQYKEDDIINVLKCFTNINYLRRGKNQKNLDNIKHILVSGDSLTRRISSDNDAKIEETNFSFSTDIYYITQRLWFKLNKGFGFRGKLPTTLDVVSKAQVILSNKLNNVVRERFDKIKKDIIDGTRTENEVKSYFVKLRDTAAKPEDLNFENIDEKTAFLYDNEDLENHIRQESLTQQELAELKEYKKVNESEKQKLFEIQEKKDTDLENSRVKKINNKIDLKINLVNTSIYLILVIIIVMTIILRKSDDVWETVNNLITIVTFIIWLGLFTLKKKLIKSLLNKKA